MFYTSSFIGAVFPLFFIPYLIRELGIDGYTVSALLVLFASILSIFDFGITALHTRMSAELVSNKLKLSTYINIRKRLRLWYVSLGIGGFVVLLVFGAEIVKNWSGSAYFIENVTFTSLLLFISVLILRWIAVYYNSAIYGFGDLNFIAINNLTMLSAKYLPLFLLFNLFEPSIEIFLQTQIFAGFLEVASTSIRTKYLISKRAKEDCLCITESKIEKFGFATKLGVTTALWAFVTQFDKIIISKVANISGFGEFSIALTSASALLLIASPITQYMLPKLIESFNSGGYLALQSGYLKFNKAILMILTPPTLVLVFFSDSVIYVWTGNVNISENVSAVMSLYSISNFLMIVGGMPYSLQFATGGFKYHLNGTIAFSLIALPTLYVLIEKYGMEGAGMAWVVVNSLQFILWLPYLHNKLIPNLHYKWLSGSFIPMTVAPMILIVLIKFFVPISDTRSIAAIEIMLFGTLLLLTTAFIYKNLHISNKT